MGWLKFATQKQICCLLLLAIIYGALGQDGLLAPNGEAASSSSEQRSDEQIGALDQSPQQQQQQQSFPTTGGGGGDQQQQRKDLNELPEMHKAKELRTEAEREELEAERMRELAKLEAELKAKDEEATMGTTTAEGPTQSEKPKEEVAKSAMIAANSNETESSSKMMETSSSGEGEEVLPSGEVGEGAINGQPPSSFAGEEQSQTQAPPALGVEEKPKTDGTNSSEAIGSSPEDQMGTTMAPIAAEGVEAVTTAIQFQQEALVTTHRIISSTQRPHGEEESGGVDDPFQTSSTPSSNGEGRQQPENDGGGGEQSEHDGGGPASGTHEMEHELIQQTVHVHQPSAEHQGGASGGGGDGKEEEKKEEEELPMPGMGHEENGSSTTTKSPAIQQTETLVSSEIGAHEEPKKEAGETTEKSVEESGENADVHHEVTVGEHHGQQEESETSTISAGILHSIDGRQSTLAHPAAIESESTEAPTMPEEGKEEASQSQQQEHEPTEMPSHQPEKTEEEHPIVFPAALLPNDQTQPPPTTEESSVIAGDKSVFEKDESGERDKKLPEPEKAKIQLMSHEGEPKESKEKTTERPEEQGEQNQEHQSTAMPPHGPMVVNEGSDGFELITKEEHGDAPPNQGGTSEKPEEAKEMSGAEEEAEMMPTPADETTQHGPMEGMGGGDGQQPAAAGEAADHHSMASTMPTTTTTTMANQQNEHEKQPMEGGGGQMMEHSADGIGEASSTTMVGPIQQQTEAEADTPPQGGDLPGAVETSHPMDSEPTTMLVPVEMMSTTPEDKSINGVQEPGATSDSEVLPMPTTSMSPEQLELAKAQAHRTPFTLRLADIEWRPEFEDVESGAAKKLREQLDSDLRAVLAAATGPTNPLIDFRLITLRPGSVIVEGEMLTKEEVNDPKATVAALEQAILAKGGMLGGNTVDTDQLNVAGQMPNGSTPANNLMAAGQQKQQQQQDATNTGLIIGGAVVVGVLIVVFAIFAIVVFGLNSRRNNCGTLKLNGGRREEICMVENGKAGTGPFGGANGRRLFGSVTGNNNNGGTNAGGIIPSSADAAETGNGGVNLMSLRTTAGSNTPTLMNNNNNNVGGGNGHGLMNPNYGHHQNGHGHQQRPTNLPSAYANGSGSGARP